MLPFHIADGNEWFVYFNIIVLLMNFGIIFRSFPLHQRVVLTYIFGFCGAYLELNGQIILIQDFNFLTIAISNDAVSERFNLKNVSIQILLL